MFTVPGGHPEGPGHIRIPAAEVRRLLGKGGQGAQVVGPSGVWVKPQPSGFLALLFWIPTVGLNRKKGKILFEIELSI